MANKLEDHPKVSVADFDNNLHLTLTLAHPEMTRGLLGMTFLQ